MAIAHRIFLWGFRYSYLQNVWDHPAQEKPTPRLPEGVVRTLQKQSQRNWSFTKRCGLIPQVACVQCRTWVILLSCSSVYSLLGSPLQPHWGLLPLLPAGRWLLVLLWARVCSPVAHPSAWHNRLIGLKLLTWWSAMVKVLNKSVFSLIVLYPLMPFIH